MFSQTTEYALRAAVALAWTWREQGAQASLTAADIAARCQAPTPYLVKVLQGLARAGLVEALRGKYGGYSLNRPPAEISLLDVVEASGPLERIRRCPLGLPAHTRLCPLHQQMDDAVALAEERLARHTLDDMLASVSGDMEAGSGLATGAEVRVEPSCLGPVFAPAVPQEVTP